MIGMNREQMIDALLPLFSRKRLEQMDDQELSIAMGLLRQGYSIPLAT